MKLLMHCMLLLSLAAPALPAQSAVAPTVSNTYTTSTLEGGKFGMLTVYRPAGEIKSVVLFLSGDGGWHLGVIDAAQKFVSEGALVVGIDVRQYLSAIRPHDAAAATQRCVSLAGDFENLSHYVQRALDLVEYQPPSLVGYSSGATIVYAALAQAPRGTFRSAISLGFCPDQIFNGALPCKVYGLSYSVESKPKSVDNVIFEPHKQLGDPWIAAQGARDQVCNADTARSFAASIPSARLLDLPRVGHGFSVTANWWPQLRAAYAELPSALPAKSTTEPGNTTADEIGTLPVHEVPTPERHSDRLALLITGDGGWAGFDQDLAAELAANGIPVVALSSVKYFWHARTPEQTTTDVATMLRHYLRRWHCSRIMLVGYSFGADVLPFVVNRLPADLRDQVSSMTLLGPSHQANFEISVAGWMPGVTVKGAATLPELQRMSAVPVLCVHGSEERDSLCPDLKSANEHVLTIGTGHHFGGDVKDITAAMLGNRQ
jgi:type IV secretory pathway VirJ component